MQKHQSEGSKSIVTQTNPPVVSILGHVDHGKTTLLDRIRKTNIVNSEVGGITQSIGASQTEVIQEGKTRQITFIDTPGHVAFSDMRSQGVNASDIVLLVVSADDSVKPQTKESIELIKRSNTPFIVVITKIDLPTANVERVKQGLLKENVALEGLGGNVPYVSVSAKTGEKIEELLDLILLVYDLAQIKKNEKGDFLGVVIDSKQDKKRGITATVVVKSGMIRVSDSLFTKERSIGRVRAVFNTWGKNIKFAVPGNAVEILGVEVIVPAGTLLFSQEQRLLPQKLEVSVTDRIPLDLKALFAEQNKNVMRFVLKTRTAAELEAIKNALPKENVKVVYTSVGDIQVSDILLAKDFDAMIFGFNVEVTPEVLQLAQNEGVGVKTYHIIYELLDEAADRLAALSAKRKETILGQGVVIAEFERQNGKILGVKVNEGRIALGDNVRLLRQKKEIGTAKIVSLKRGKEDVKEVGKGLECGLTISPQVDFVTGDVLLSYSLKS